jgi:hypothetical protein
MWSQISVKSNKCKVKQMQSQTNAKSNKCKVKQMQSQTNAKLDKQKSNGFEVKQTWSSLFEIKVSNNPISISKDVEQINF